VETGVLNCRAPVSKGFGTKILNATVEAQLRGRAAFEWEPDGLRCELSFPLQDVTSSALTHASSVNALRRSGSSEQLSDRALKKVLLVEADLRLPTLNKHFQLQKRLGFSSALMEPWTKIEAKLTGQATHIPGLDIVAAEVPLRNSSDLLQAPQVKQIFEYFQHAPYDYVVFDTPPLLPVADAQLLAAYIHTAVLVVDSSKSSRRILARAKDLLNKTSTRVLGVVVNKSSWTNSGYGYGYGHYGQEGGHSEKAVTAADEVRQPKLTNARVEG